MKNLLLLLRASGFNLYVHEVFPIVTTLTIFLLHHMLGFVHGLLGMLLDLTLEDFEHFLGGHDRPLAAGSSRDIANMTSFRRPRYQLLLSIVDVTH